MARVRSGVEDVVDPAGTEVEPTFDGVYAASRPEVVRTAFLIVGSRAVAEEIAQEAFLRLYRHFPEVRNPGGFLRTTVVRLCLTWRERASAEAARWQSVGDPPPVGDADVDVVWDAMARLRPERRAALILRYYEDLAYEDVAHAMGCRVSTARTRVHRALADLRRELEASPAPHLIAPRSEPGPERPGAEGAKSGGLER